MDVDSTNTLSIPKRIHLFKMSEEELQEQIIQQIEVLVEELGGSMCHSIRCNSMGRQSKVIEIEYNVEG